MSDLQSLISMGFSKEKAEEALVETNNAGIELAIEWLIVTDGNVDVGNEEEKDLTRAQIASLDEKLFNCHLEAVDESLKQTETKCEKRETSSSCEMSVNSDKDTHIRVRFLDGKTLTKTFKAQAKLNAVVLWIQSHINTNQFGLMTNFPKKVFTDEDYNRSLDALNLFPSAALIVTPPEKWDDLKVYQGIKTDDESRKADEKRRHEEIETQLRKKEEESLALKRVRAQIEDDKAARRQRWPDLYSNSSQPSENHLLQNQPQALLPLANRNQNHERNKKFE